jgi:pto-interacting protein 1
MVALFELSILLSFCGTLGYPKGSKVAAPVKAELQKEAPPIEVPALSLEELKEKTDNFGSKALIGEGSYGRVYYASLENGKAVAVKKLDVASEPETNFEFLTQVCCILKGKERLASNYLFLI